MRIKERYLNVLGYIFFFLSIIFMIAFIRMINIFYFFSISDPMYIAYLLSLFVSLFISIYFLYISYRYITYYIEIKDNKLIIFDLYKKVIDISSIRRISLHKGNLYKITIEYQNIGLVKKYKFLFVESIYEELENLSKKNNIVIKKI